MRIIRFYYENCMGDSGYFTERKDNIVNAIYSAWNIEAILYIAEKIKDNKKKEAAEKLMEPCKNQSMEAIRIYLNNSKWKARREA